MKEKEFLSLLLPDGMMEYFEITEVEKHPDSYTIHLSERNIYLNCTNMTSCCPKVFMSQLQYRIFRYGAKHAI